MKQSTTTTTPTNGLNKKQKNKRQPEAGKRLYKSADNAVLCGVCGGIAEYFGIDVTLLRLALVLSALLLPNVGGPLIVAYVIACIIIPENPRKRGTIAPVKKIQQMSVAHELRTARLEKKCESEKKSSTTGSLIAIGLVMVAVGTFYLLWFEGYIPQLRSLNFDWSTHWYLALIAAGVVLFLFGVFKKIFK